ncbi:hypothetical protein ACLB2K_029701 [Fragaria x ananassa]
MNVSHGSVHPVDDVPTTDGAAGPNPPRVRMKDLPGMPGTPAGLTLRLSQFLFSAAALAVMASTSDFPSVTAFCYLVAATGLQTLWSFSLAIADVYALLVGRSLQSHKVVCLFTLGDGMTSTLTFAAACASAGITVLIDNDLDSCAHNHCAQFETATAMAFITWFTALPSFLMNFWSLASSGWRTTSIEVRSIVLEVRQMGWRFLKRGALLMRGDGDGALWLVVNSGDGAEDRKTAARRKLFGPGLEVALL